MSASQKSPVILNHLNIENKVTMIHPGPLVSCEMAGLSFREREMLDDESSSRKKGQKRQVIWSRGVIEHS